MVRLVLRGRSSQDPRRIRGRRLAHEHRHEAAFQRRVALDVLAELIVRGRADARKLAAREGRLQFVRSVLRPLAGRARADQHVQLVDEDDEAPLGAPDLVLDPDQALAERAAELGSSDETAHVELEQEALAAQDPQRKPLHDGGLAHSGFADEDRIVRPPLAEDVEELLRLSLTAQGGIELPFLGERREIARVRGEPGKLPRIEEGARRRPIRFGHGSGFGSALGFLGWRKRGDPHRRRRPLCADGSADVGRARRGHGRFPAPRDGPGEIAERRGAEGSDGRGGLLQQVGSRAAGKAGERDEKMEAPGARVSTVERELARSLQRVAEGLRRLFGGLAVNGELREHAVFVAAALAQQHVRGAGHRECGEQEVLRSGRLAGVPGDVLRFCGDLRELCGVEGHRCRHPRLQGSSRASGKLL